MKQNPYYPDSPAGNQDYGPNDNRSRPEINDGGPAFPSPEYDEDGMSLRDWFAGQALMGMAASSTWSDNVSVGKNETRSAWMEEVARHAYVMADEMLAQRNQK